MSEHDDTERGESLDRARSRLGAAELEVYDQLIEELDAISPDRPQSALERIGRALDDLPEDASAHLRGAVLAERADWRLDADRVQPARGDVEAALEAGWRPAEVHVTGGWASYELDRPGEARDHFDAALEVDPDRVSALQGRSLALKDIDELELARADLTHALQLAPEDAQLYSLRAEVLAGLGELDRAERDVEQAMELAPRAPDYALDRARLSMVRADTERALEAVDRALQRGETLEGLLLRSHLHRSAGREERARRDALRASNAYPDRAFAFVQLAQIELSRDHVDLAERAADRAVALDAKLPDAYMVRGLVRQKRGRREAASSDLERAREAPAELPMFLLGSFYDVFSVGQFDQSIMDLLGGAGDASAERPGPADLGGLDPGDLMGELFDDSGDLDDRFRPAFEMAMDNAPDLLDQLPDELVEQVGPIDEGRLESLSEMSPEEMEQRLRRLYQWLDAGPDGSDEGAGGTS